MNFNKEIAAVTEVEVNQAMEGQEKVGIARFGYYNKKYRNLINRKAYLLEIGYAFLKL